MAKWQKPTSAVIAGNTKIKDVDEKLNAIIDDASAWLNGEAPYNANTGSVLNRINVGTAQTDQVLQYDGTKFVPVNFAIGSY